MLAASPVAMDLLAREVMRAGEAIDLQPCEFAFLEHLVCNAGRPVSKTAIQQHVWDFDFNPQTNVVEVLVHRLRQKVDHGSKPKPIHPVRGLCPMRLQSVSWSRSGS